MPPTFFSSGYAPESKYLFLNSPPAEMLILNIPALVFIRIKVIRLVRPRIAEIYNQFKNTVNSLLSPRGAYLLQALQRGLIIGEGALIRERGLNKFLENFQ